MLIYRGLFKACNEIKTVHVLLVHGCILSQMYDHQRELIQCATVFYFDFFPIVYLRVVGVCVETNSSKRSFHQWSTWNDIFYLYMCICNWFFNEMLNCHLAFIIDLFVCIHNSNPFYFIVHKLLFYINL